MTEAVQLQPTVRRSDADENFSIYSKQKIKERTVTDCGAVSQDFLAQIEDFSGLILPPPGTGTQIINSPPLTVKDINGDSIQTSRPLHISDHLDRNGAHLRDKGRLTTASVTGLPARHTRGITTTPADQNLSGLKSFEIVGNQYLRAAGTCLPHAPLTSHSHFAVAFTPTEIPHFGSAATHIMTTAPPVTLVQPGEVALGSNDNNSHIFAESLNSPEGVMPTLLCNTPPLKDGVELRICDDSARRTFISWGGEYDCARSDYRITPQSIRVLDLIFEPEKFGKLRVRLAISEVDFGVNILTSNSDTFAILQQSRNAILERISASGYANVDVCINVSCPPADPVADLAEGSDSATLSFDNATAFLPHSEGFTEERDTPEMLGVAISDRPRKARPVYSPRLGLFV